jgi:hypothetical protein
MNELKAIGASYGRSAIAGMLAVYMTGETDIKKLAWGLFAGIVPVLMRYANPNDVSFGAKSSER